MILIDAEQWQRAWDEFRERVAPIWRDIQRICETFYGVDEQARIEQRQRITAAKRRARLVTRAKVTKGR